MFNLKNNVLIQTMIISENSKRNREAYVTALKDRDEYEEKVIVRDGREEHEVPVEQLAKEFWLLYKDHAKWKNGAFIFNQMDEEKGVKSMNDKLRRFYNRENVHGRREATDGTRQLNAKAKGGRLWLVRGDCELSLAEYFRRALEQNHDTKRVEDMPRGFLGGSTNNVKLKKMYHVEDPKVHDKVVTDAPEQAQEELPPLPITESNDIQVQEKTYIVKLEGEGRIAVQATSMIAAKAKAFDELGFEIEQFDLKGPMVSRG